MCGERMSSRAPCGRPSRTFIPLICSNRSSRRPVKLTRSPLLISSCQVAAFWCTKGGEGEHRTRRGGQTSSCGVLLSVPLRGNEGAYGVEACGGHVLKDSQTVCAAIVWVSGPHLDDAISTCGEGGEGGAGSAALHHLPTHGRGLEQI
jgi:hypothetical protein